MKILRLLILFILIGVIPVYAAPKRVEIKQLTIGGAAVKAYAVATSTTLTSDSIYQSGNSGYTSLATNVGGNAGILTVKYQVSYDNVNWFKPSTTSAGALTTSDTLATNMTSDTWIVLPYTMTPYIRFIFSSGTATTDSITADAIWQDES